MKYPIAFLLVLLSCSFAFSQEKTLFDRATEVYNKGEYSKAIDYYERILNSGKHSSELYFNMGNAHYKLEHVGESIYYYEKALLLKPNDPEIKNNLGYAQNMRLDAIEEVPKTALRKIYTNIVNLLSYDQWAKLAVICILIFVLSFSAYYLLNMATKKRIFFIGGNIFLLVSLASFALAQLAYQDYKSQNPAIIFSREVVVSAEPNERAEKVFTLHEGTKVNVLEDLSEWAKIQIADGQIGWVNIQSLKRLKDF